MKYIAEIELDENRTSCLSCPLCGPDDYCQLLDEDECFEHGASWEWQLEHCPLKKA